MSRTLEHFPNLVTMFFTRATEMGDAPFLWAKRGGSWQATHDTRIATVSCGYADGYPRHAPSGTPVWLQGQRVPLAGRVSMDMLCVDVGVLPSVQLGSAVELWGQRLPVDEVARAAGTLGYELLTRVTARVPRRY